MRARTASQSLVAVVVALFVAGCAATATPTASAPGVAPVSAAATVAGPAAAGATPASGGASVSNGAAAPAAAAGLKSFAEIVKDAKHADGLFTVWQKDDKVWLEVAPEQFDRPYLLATTRTRGLGERGMYGNWLLDEYVVEFRRVGNLVQMIARNEAFTTADKTPLAYALRDSFTDSLLASSNVVSLPHPERKTVLVEANPLFVADIPSMSTQLETLYRLSYAFDARNSHISATRATSDMITVEVDAHYALPRLPVPPLMPPPNPALPQPTLPHNIVDGRSLFLGLHYSLATLPDPPMHMRPADDRVGHFVTERWDFTDELARTPRFFAVDRWRLEKKDPAAALSEPVKPIVFWLDRNIPERYRDTVKAGVLEWNKAFERIGFKDAIRVELQPADADFNLADVRHASIRWFLDTDEGALARGPAHVDPRSGEIIDADIGVSDNWARLPRRLAIEQFPTPKPAATIHRGHAEDTCEYANEAMAETEFALDLLEARGEIDPDSPQAEEVVKAVLKDVITHEVGHTLGLRHNFRASTTVPLARLADKAWTHVHGISGSVMDYNAFNIALEGEPQGDYAMATIGPYDYWAIEYAYKPLAPEHEAEALAAIAARSTEPALAYGTDEEAAGPAGYDPEVNQRDLGDDPLAFATRRVALSRELWRRLQDKPLKDGESYAVRRRNVESGLRQFSLAADIASKYIGGVVFLHDHAGTSRASYNPVPVARQREALKLIADNLFSASALRFKPEFVARLAQDGLERGMKQPALPGLAQIVFSTQKSVLEHVMSDTVAARLLEAQAEVGDPSQVLSLAELDATVQRAIWSELRTGGDIPLARRALQREHLRFIAGMLLKPSAGTPADARALARANALELARDLKRAQGRKELSAEARAHVAESLVTIEEALSAPMTRGGA